MEKALCVLLSFIMCFSMTACVGDQANNGSEFLNAVFTDATEAPFVEVPSLGPVCAKRRRCVQQ